GSDVDVHRRLVQAPTGGGVVQRDGHGDGGGLVLARPAGLGDPADVADAALGVAAVGQHHLDAVAGADVALLAAGQGGGGRGVTVWAAWPGAAWPPTLPLRVFTRTAHGKNTAGMVVVNAPVWASPRAFCQRLTAALVAQS